MTSLHELMSLMDDSCDYIYKLHIDDVVISGNAYSISKVFTDGTLESPLKKVSVHDRYDLVEVWIDRKD